MSALQQLAAYSDEEDDESELGPVQGPQLPPFLEHSTSDGQDCSQPPLVESQSMHTLEDGHAIEENEPEHRRDAKLSCCLFLSQSEQVELPLTPIVPAHPRLQKKLEEWSKARAERGVYFNDAVVSSAEFHNPSLYKRMIDFMNLDEVGSNFPANVYDPYGMPSSAYAESLARRQDDLLKKAQDNQQQPSRPQINFVPANTRFGRH